MDDSNADHGSGSGLWVRWVVATAIGVLVAFAGFVVIFEIFGEPDHLLFPVLMTAVGIVFGAFQQRVLRGSMGDTRNWALATGFGFGVGIALALAIGEGSGLGGKIVAGLVHGAAVGAIVGTLQWRVLQTRLPGARLWVAVSVGGWAIAAAVADAAGYFVDGIDIVVAPVVAAAVTGVALDRLTSPGGPSRPDHRAPLDPAQITGADTRSGRSLRRSNGTRSPSATLSIASLLALFLGACADDGSASTAEPASSADRAIAETSDAASGSTADSVGGAASSDLCTLVGEIYEQDDIASVEQLKRYQQLVPDEIADQVNQVAEPLIANGGDTTSFFKIIAADNNEAAIAEIDAWEEKNCGIPHSEDSALPQGASRELDPDATRVDVHTTDYAFHIGSVAPGRTSFVLTNDGAETHEMLLVKLAEGFTLADAMQAEGGDGTVEAEWMTHLAAPGGDDEVITLDVEPGDYALVCFIPSADGTPHALLGMQHEFTVH